MWWSHFLRALGLDHADHIIYGQPIGVVRSTGHLREVNVIGASFFLENELEFTLNYLARIVNIDSASILAEEQEDEL